MRDLSSTLVRNALFGSGARLLTLAVGLLMTPYLLTRLGADRFGIWALVAVVTGVVGLLDFSVKSSFVKYLSEAIALRDQDASASILSTGLFAYSLFSGVMLMVFWFGSDLVLIGLSIPDVLFEEARLVFILGVAGYLLGSVFAVFPAVCDARQRMDVTNSLGVVSLVASSCFTVFAVENGWGLRGVAWAQFSGIALFFLSCLYAARKVSGPLGISPSRISRTWFSRLFVFGWKLHISSICGIVNRQLDKLILSRYAGLGFVSSYEVALRAASNAGTLQPYLAAALLPASSQMHASGRQAQLLAVYQKATRYLFLVGIPPFIYLATQSRTFIMAWLGQPDNNASLILLCLAMGYMVNSLSNGMAFVCQGIGKPGIQSRQSALQLGVNVVLSLLLVRMIGPMGAPVGTSLALILGAIYFARTFHRHLGISTFSLLRDTAGVPIAASILGVLIAWLFTGQMLSFTRTEALMKLALSWTVFSTVVMGFYLSIGSIGRPEIGLLFSAMRPAKERASL